MAASSRSTTKHVIKKGTGVWGWELDDGDILIIEKVRVDSCWRRSRMGTAIVNTILGQVQRQTAKGFLALVCPIPSSRTAKWETVCGGEQHMEKMTGDQIAMVERFWRSLGFRRVGVSLWFAFTDNADHLSRQLDASHDWDNPRDIGPQSPLPWSVRNVFSVLSSRKMSDEECLKDLRDTFPENPSDPSWSSSDHRGNTLLRVAAINSKPKTTKYVLSKKPDLAAVRNVGRLHTPRGFTRPNGVGENKKGDSQGDSCNLRSFLWLPNKQSPLTRCSYGRGYL